MINKKLPYLLIALILLVISCEENSEINSAQKDPVKKVQVTSLAQEPQLEYALDVAGFSRSKTGRTSKNGASLNINKIIKVLQGDNHHQTFTFKIDDPETNSFSNLVIQELEQGYLGFILQYRSEGRYTGMETFTGTISRYDLEGTLLSEGRFVQGSLVPSTGVNGKVSQESAGQCIVGSQTYTECAVWGSTFTHQLTPTCLEYITIIILEVDDCPTTDPAPPTGPIPPSDGGTFIPGTSGGSPSPSPTPTDDPDAGNNIQPIPGYTPPIGVISDDEVAITIEQMLEENPYALIEIDCKQLAKWLSVGSFKPPVSAVNKIKTLRQNYPGQLALFTGNFDMQMLEDASGTVVNMDYFSVRITKLPLVNGSPATASEFLTHIRKNINSFVNTQYSQFTPYTQVNTGDDEAALWASSNPVNAIMHIQIPYDDGSVICSESTGSRWKFTTISAPWDHEHPVSGTREFGFETNADGTYTFYTRGVDRITQTLNSMLAESASFDGADNLWNSFQDKLLNYTLQNGGTATKNRPIMERPDWSSLREVFNGTKPISSLGCK